MPFERLQVSEWRQYGRVDIHFHPRLTVITGANATGKTTLLNILGQHFGWQVQLIGVPYRDRDSPTLRFFTSWFRRAMRPAAHLPASFDSVGTLSYVGEGSTPIAVPAESGSGYQVTLPQIRPVDGIFVPSHRTPYFYQQVQSIPLSTLSPQQLYGIYSGEQRTRYTGGQVISPSFRLKEALISWAALGYGNEVIIRDDSSVALFESFQEVLRLTLPESLGFDRLEIIASEVVVISSSGRFSIDSLSGGTSAIVDMAWQIFLYAQDKDKFCVILDEPENHLHPALQRELLPNLVRAFPGAQFIVATHSPFMVTATEDSEVYALTFVRDEPGGERLVVSSQLDFIAKSSSAADILREVLGVPATIPIWAERQLERVVSKFVDRELSDSSLADLRRELVEIGLEDFLPQSVAQILGRRPS